MPEETEETAVWPVSENGRANLASEAVIEFQLFLLRII